MQEKRDVKGRSEKTDENTEWMGIWDGSELLGRKVITRKVTAKEGRILD
jgi:hypothetical protein